MHPQRIEGIATTSAGRLRLGCDPLHHHLVPAEVMVRAHWKPIQAWGEQILAGQVDAALISVAACAAATVSDDHAPQPMFLPAADLMAETSRSCPGLTFITLGSLPLVLVHARCHCQVPITGTRRLMWSMLLPAAEQQPLLWRELKRLDLLPVQECRAAETAGWLAQLRTAPQLLPADLSLLEQLRWREAGLLAVPPPVPMAETLWLLVKEEVAPQPLYACLIADLRRLIMQRQSLQP